MGHKTSYEAPQIPGSDVHYFSRDIERHRKQYEQFAMPNLRISERSALDYDAQLREKAEEIEDLRSQLAKRDKKIAELERKTEGLHEFKETFERSKTLEEAFVRFKRLKDKEFETS